MPQIDNLDAELTVRENLLMYARYFDIPGDVAKARAEELLDFVQLTERAGDQVDPLSGGMKRRLTIARALINEPDLLLLDEPTTGLDPQARHLVWDRLYRLKSRGVTLVVTTHYMDEAEQLCDRLVVMDHAKIVASGSPRELIEQYSTREVLELRMTDAVRGSLNGRLDDLADRVEELPDRHPAVRGRRRAGARGRPCPRYPHRVRPRPAVHAGGRLPPPHRPHADRMTALRVTQRNLWVYRRTWRGSVFGSFLSPLLFLGALGVGLGSFIAAQDESALGGVTYIEFLGPGLLAATCMQTSSFEAMWPIMGKISWRRNYEAMLAAPLSVRDLVFGEMGWMAFRLTTVSFAFLIVLTLFGIPSSPLAILAWPAAVLTGLAFFAAIVAFTATQKNDSGFAAIFRFVINPLFLFSGTFFPVDRLPDAIEFIAALTPLYHGVALIRGLMLETPELANWPIHLGYLVVFLGVATWLAYRFLYRRLVK